MTRVLTFREHLGHEETLSPVEVELVRASPLKLDVQRIGEALYRISPSSIVGSDVAEGLKIVVVPKLPIRRLLYVLSSYPEGLELGKWIAQVEADDTLAALAEIYREALDRALVFGLPREYREEQGDLELVRGRVDLLELLCKHSGLFPPIPCEYDEHTADTESSRRLLAAARLLRSGTTTRLETAERLRALVSQLAQTVSQTSYPRFPAPAPKSRLVDAQLGHGAKSYRSALDLAELILRHGSVEVHEGAVSSISFVVDMDKAFQHFVARTLRATLRVPPGLWIEEPTHYLDEGRQIPSRPDVVWNHASGRPLLVIDAKWKRTAQGENDDVRQMVLYCTALGVPRGVLVYGQAGRSYVHAIKNSPIRIYVVGLDLDGELPVVKARVVDLGEQLRSVASVGSAADLLGEVPARVVI